MVHGNGQAGAQTSGGPVGPVLNLLNKILDFLFVKLGSLPPSLRPLAYFVFLAFFCATTWRLVAGQYVVNGVIWSADGYARGCEVKIRKDFFSVNSNGMYYAVLSPAQYYRYAAVGETKLPVFCTELRGDGKDKHVVRRETGVFKVALSLWDDEFSEIHLSGPAAVPSASKDPGGFSFSLIASAYAQELPAPRPKAPVALQPAPPPAESIFPSRGDRLVVERIMLGSSARHMHKVEFEVELGEEERPLLLQGAEAGELPLKSVVTFGERYYFDVPRSRRGTVVGVEMETGGLFGKEERFKFQVPKQYNTPLSVQGSKGSILVLRLLPRTPNASR
jgi:hypothetical protein